MNIGGQRSAKSGRILEDHVEKTVTDWFPTMPIKRWDNTCSLLSDGLYKAVPFTSIYNKVSKTEFVLVLGGEQIRIECKWQSSAGTVDEKYPYMFLNMLQCGQKRVIFLVDGKGARPEAITWLKSECNSANIYNDKIFMVLDMGSFLHYIQVLSKPKK